jgi:hypothetical protein
VTLNSFALTSCVEATLTPSMRTVVETEKPVPSIRTSVLSGSIPPKGIITRDTDKVPPTVKLPGSGAIE